MPWWVYRGINISSIGSQTLGIINAMSGRLDVLYWGLFDKGYLLTNADYGTLIWLAGLINNAPSMQAFYISERSYWSNKNRDRASFFSQLKVLLYRIFFNIE